MDRNQVMRWVDGYITAWRDEDAGGIERLFTEDARYRASPYEEPEVGHQAIEAFWLGDAGEVFTAAAEPFAVDGSRQWFGWRCATANRCGRNTATCGC